MSEIKLPVTLKHTGVFAFHHLWTVFNNSSRFPGVWLRTTGRDLPDGVSVHKS